MSSNTTVDNILDAAEALFAENGFTETSLRAITSKAGVNLAAVNYHFGSKQELIQAVFARFLDPFSMHLQMLLDKRFSDREENPPELKELLDLFAYTIYDMRSERLKTKDQVFVRLIDLAYNQGEGHLLSFLKDKYGALFAQYSELYRLACPEVPEKELFWRLHFSLGAAMFSLSGLDILSTFKPLKEGEENPTQIEVYKYIIPFLIAGITAPSIDGKE